MMHINFVPNNISIASQIAHILNMYSNLRRVHTYFSIAASNDIYFCEVDINTKRVIGCIALEHILKQYSKITHLCVVPEYRNYGVGKKLMYTALRNAVGTGVQLTVRTDNLNSLNLMNKFNFKIVKKELCIDHYVATLWRDLNARNDELCYDRSSF